MFAVKNPEAMHVFEAVGIVQQKRGGDRMVRRVSMFAVKNPEAMHNANSFDDVWENS